MNVSRAPPAKLLKPVDAGSDRFALRSARGADMAAQMPRLVCLMVIRAWLWDGRPSDAGRHEANAGTKQMFDQYSSSTAMPECAIETGSSEGARARTSPARFT